MPPHNPSTSPKQTSPKSHRFLLYFAAVILTFLLLWLWSFLLNDIAIVNRPDLRAVESSIIDQAIEARLEELQDQSSTVTRQINDLRQSQALLRDSTNNTRETMNQLLENQKALADKNISLSPAEQEAIAQSQKLFLDNQAKYQDLNQELVELTAENRRLTDEMALLKRQLEPYREKAYDRYRELTEKAQIKSAIIQLSILLPLFLLAFWLIIKKRNTTYGLLVYPFGISLFLKIMSVAHEYFPSRYFKYIALLGLIAAVIGLMMYLLRMMVRPNTDLILKRNREAYNNHRCPTCAFPIQQSLIHRLGLNTKRARIIELPAGESSTPKPYACPSCGEQLYEKCENCSNVRHSLLPYCEHCGNSSSTLSAIHPTEHDPAN